MLHIHFGPSPLALGLLLPASIQAGFDVAVIGRPGRREAKTFGRGGSAPGQRLQWFDVDWFEGPYEFEDLPTDLVRRIESDESVLVTATLRNHVEGRKAFIVELLRRRPEGRETVVMACENAPHAAYQEIKQEAEVGGALFLRTVVNRMCVAAASDEGRRIVSAHPLGEWLVERPPVESLVLDALKRAVDVEVVDDIEARHDRKLWMVNGAHQALALAARQDNRRRRELRAAAREPERLARLSYVHAAMNEALRRKHGHLEKNLDYALSHVTAYCEHKDSIVRVLGSFNRADLEGFFDCLDARLGEPARVCFEHKIDVEPFLQIVDVLEGTVGELLNFIDGRDIRRGKIRLDADADAKALAAYTRFVTGWLPADETLRRVQTMREILNDQFTAQES